MSVTVAIDQGTTSTRGLVLDADGHVRLVGGMRHAQHHPRDGWVEHDPEILLAHIVECLALAGPADRIGLANQGESCLAWDAATGRPLSPVIVWQDRRTEPEVAQLRAAGAEAETLARAGLPLDPYFSASKLAWLLRHSAEVAEARRAGRLRLGTTDAFFLERLTGLFVTDRTTASRTSLMHLATGVWDTALCDLFGVPIECLPEIRDTVSAFGAIGRGLVTASLVDQQAGLIGHGCRDVGDTKVTFGTGAFVQSITGAEIVRREAQGMLPTVAWSVDGRPVFAVDGGVYDAGSAVEWARSLGLFSDYAELARFDAPPAIERGVAFVPALSGLACPHWDRRAGAVWIGMTAATGAADLRQAVLEGVALRTAEVVDALGQANAGGPISVDGGLTRSDYFVQFLADVLARPVVRPGFDELTAFGCAVLAAGRLHAPPPLPCGTGRTFTPRSVASREWRARFSDAVSRSRGWR